MSEQLMLLSQPTNFAVVQLPGRSFPGVVIQGDSLFSIVKSVSRLQQLLGSNELDELEVEIEDIRECLSSALAHYESVCKREGISLPYSRDESIDCDTGSE